MTNLVWESVQVVRANANKLFLFKSFLTFDLESHSGEPLKDFRNAFVVSIKGKQGSLAAFEQFFPQNNSKRMRIGRSEHALCPAECSLLT